MSVHVAPEDHTKFVDTLKNNPYIDKIDTEFLNHIIKGQRLFSFNEKLIKRKSRRKLKLLKEGDLAARAGPEGGAVNASASSSIGHAVGAGSSKGKSGKVARDVDEEEDFGEEDELDDLEEDMDLDDEEFAEDAEEENDEEDLFDTKPKKISSTSAKEKNNSEFF